MSSRRSRVCQGCGHGSENLARGERAESSGDDYLPMTFRNFYEHKFLSACVCVRVAVVVVVVYGGVCVVLSSCVLHVRMGCVLFMKKKFE